MGDCNEKIGGRFSTVIIILASIGLVGIIGFLLGNVILIPDSDTIDHTIPTDKHSINKIEQEDLFVETGGLHIEKEERYERSFEYIEGKGTTEINTKTHTTYTVYDGNVKLVRKIIEEYQNQEHIAYFCLESDHNASECYLPVVINPWVDHSTNVHTELFEIPEGTIEQEEQMTIVVS